MSLGLSGRLTTDSLFSLFVASWLPLSPKAVVSYDYRDIDYSVNQQDPYLMLTLANSSAEAALDKYSKILNRDTS